MKTRNLVTVAALMLAVLFTSCDKDESFVSNLTGTWEMTMTLNGGGSFPITVVANQSANGAVNGTIGANEFSGSVIDADMLMTYRNTEDVAINYYGHFESENYITGSFNADGAYLGTFSATRVNE